MTEKEMLDIISDGENIHVEFKKSRTEITKDVYETVCSFSNRDGGHIFLGVKDNGDIVGVQEDCIDKIKKNFITSVNNKDKIFPPLYLSMEDYVIDGKTVICIYVPICNQVCRCSNRIYDRKGDADLDITEQGDAVYRLYARKNSSYFVNKVTNFKLDSLNPNLIERARRMTRTRANDHPWNAMNDEELLRSAGLILTDEQTGKEGITLAAILLFGKDSTIMSALPQHKTDAIFRVENVDRYDDRDVIITNLLDTYDRLMEFGEKHLSDPFVLEGIYRVSARNKVLREIFSNFLAHRDYSSGYVAKFVIEKKQMYTENANRANGYGVLNLSSFNPFAKNPAISKVFREIGLADELGSGMRNTYKYTELYTGGTPEFIEGDIFRTVIPLNKTAIGKVGPSDTDTPQDTPQDAHQDTHQDTHQDKIEKLRDYCKIPRSRKELQEFVGLTDKVNFKRKYLDPMLKMGLIKMTLPDKPTSRNQKYVSVKGDKR